MDQETTVARSFGVAGKDDVFGFGSGNDAAREAA
jgi:hypothetical protein